MPAPENTPDPSTAIDFGHEVAQLLAACRTASLATVADDGGPHAANVQFAVDEGFRLYWVSSSRAAHSLHLARDPRTALTVYHASDDNAASIHGLQAHGTTLPLHDPADLELAWSLYAERYPFVTEAGFRALVDSQTFYRFTPTWLRLIDNRRGFGFKAERVRRGTAWVVGE